MDFKKYFNEVNQNKDVLQSFRKLPKSYQELLKGYKVTFQAGNTLKGDGGHVGFVDEAKKSITIASPWNYSREHTLLHEVGHIVWKFKVTTELKKEWTKIAADTKKSSKETALKQNNEELFCMAFAAYYTKTPPAVFVHKEWESFIKKLPL